MADFRGTLRQGHELLAALRAATLEASRVLAACEPATLGKVMDERTSEAINAGLEGYRERIATAIKDAETAVMARFDTLVGALLGDEDPDGGLEAALTRFRDRQRILETAMLRDPQAAAAVKLAEGRPVQ